MKMTKKLIPFFFLVLLIGSISSLVNAWTSTQLAHYSESTANTLLPISGIYPTANTSIGAVCETFMPISSGWIYQVNVLMSRFGNPNGFLVCYIDGVNGTVVNDNSTYETCTNNTHLAVSDYINITALSLNTDYSLKQITINFTFSNGCPLFSAGSYALVIAGYNGTLNSDNAIWIGGNTANGYIGDYSNYYNNQWYTSANHNGADISFSVYGMTGLIFGETPVPTDSGQAQAQRTNAFWTMAINVLFGDGSSSNPFGIFIPLGMLIGFGILGAKFAGEIGFIGGLNLAILLSCLFGLLPWFVIVIIVIVDAVYIYGRNRV